MNTTEDIAATIRDRERVGHEATLHNEVAAWDE
jgi:hypothetical protein